MAGQRCKEIIDSSHAVIHAIGCMQATILIDRHVSEPTDAQRAEFKEKAEAFARACAMVEKAYGIAPAG